MSVAETTTVPEPSSAASRKRLVSTRLLRSEVRLIGGRRRNQMGLLVLAAVPIVLAISVQLSSNGRPAADPTSSTRSPRTGCSCPWRR